MKLNFINESKTDIIKKVLTGILEGGSDIREPLENGEFSILDIIKSIKTQRCLGASERDFGSTYLEQVVGSVIRDRFSPADINNARVLFGLEQLEKEDLKRQVKGKLKSKLFTKKQQKTE